MATGAASQVNAVFYGPTGTRTLDLGRNLGGAMRNLGERADRESPLSFESGASRRNLGRRQSTSLWDHHWSGSRLPRASERNRGNATPRASRKRAAITSALEWTNASQPLRRATPPSSGVPRDLAARATEPVRTTEYAPRKARERAAVEQHVGADEPLRYSRKVCGARCST